MKTLEADGAMLIANRQISSPMPVAFDEATGEWVKFTMMLVGGVPTWTPEATDPPQKYIMSDGTEWAPYVKFVAGVPTWSFHQV